ncbi:Yae1 family protein [Aspergillus tanneri]|uniref:Protein YAE1 n=1 Tax=Aspergillus tanneri TaxID=1220188 RepID=A0A5M9MTI0_9EURO|nr:Essential protein Yae1, N terminal [Aspergillus tanneri]KAA8645817.1 Essential protein Yae1, N terminal [Aspergillus tanneri]
MTSPSRPSATNSSLDDIFGSSPPHETELQNPPRDQYPLSTVEPSELPFLRRQHVTAGYRDGISASKGEHVQRGFDAGFPVGAQLGMRAGTVLGILEGVIRGYESRASSAVVKKQLPQRTEGSSSVRGNVDNDNDNGLDEDGMKELSVQSVFGTLEGGEDEKPETQLARKGDVAVSKWENRVMVSHWEENMDALQMKDEGYKKNESGTVEQS